MLDRLFLEGMARLEHPHSQGTLTEAAVAEAEADFDALVAAFDEVGGPLPGLLRRIRDLDGRLPGRAPMQDPGDTEVTLVPRPLTDGTLEARYQRLLDGRRRESGIRSNQRAALSFARGKLSTFDRRMDQVGREWSTQDKAAARLGLDMVGIHGRWSARYRSGSDSWGGRTGGRT